MRVKYFLITICSLFLAFSIFQIFRVPPWAGDIYKIYKSGYFQELDRGFDLATDAFVTIKSSSDEPAYAWIYLNDLKKQNIQAKVFDYQGNRVMAPGEKALEYNENLKKIQHQEKPYPLDQIKNGHYTRLVPVKKEAKCGFCHHKNYPQNVIGYIEYEREYDALIYYSSERVLIFSLISCLLLILLFIIIRWDPVKDVKKIF